LSVENVIPLKRFNKPFNKPRCHSKVPVPIENMKHNVLYIPNDINMIYDICYMIYDISYSIKDYKYDSIKIRKLLLFEFKN